MEDVKLMSVLKTFAGLVRVNFLPASVAPFLLGTALAYNRGYSVPFAKFIAAVTGIVSVHLAGNAANNYYDYASGADGPETLTTPFFGGTKAIVSGAVSPAAALAATAVFGSISVLSGITIFFMMKDPVFLLMTAAGIFLTFQYSAAPLRLSYRGLGETAIFFLFGPGIIMGSYYLFSGSFSLDSFLVSLVPGFLIFNVIICNEIPDAATDIRAGKKNLISIMGKSRGKSLYAFGLYCSLLVLAVNVALGALPYAAAFSLIFYVMAGRALKIIIHKHTGTSGMIIAARLTVMAHVFVTLSMAGILICGK